MQYAIGQITPMTSGVKFLASSSDLMENVWCDIGQSLMLHNM